MRGGEQERPRAVVEEVDQVLRAADVATKRADRLRERADLHIDAAMDIEVIDRAATVTAENAGSMRVVHHHDGAVLLGEHRTTRAADRCLRPWRKRRR